jgi:hypothetical protein
MSAMRKLIRRHWDRAQQSLHSNVADCRRLTLYILGIVIPLFENPIMKPTLFLAFCALALSLIAPGSGQAAQLNIPSTHPRLWFGNAARLQQGRDYFATTPFTPAGADIQYERALRGLLVNNVADCDLAADYFLAWQASAGPGGFRDDTRQQGEELMLMFDWCYARFTPAERATLITRWNGYMDREMSDNLGNQGDEANNYWSGRTRILLMWGITSFGENTRAQEFIDQALDTRMGSWFPTWYQNFGRGGVFPEGGDYGIVSLSYPLIPFVSAADFGYDAFAQTPYFTEAIYALIYGTTPGTTTITGLTTFGMSLFPFNDDEHFYEGGAINVRQYLGDFARYFGARAPTTGNARHMRAWLAQSNAGRRWLFDALGGSGNTNDLNTMPLDYYAPGAAVFDMRTSHDANATQVHLQLGTPGGVSHRHLDAGSFQIWRKGRWLTRESTGYSDRLVAYGQPSGSNITIDSSEAPAQNTLLFEGQTTGIWIGNGPQPIPPSGNPDPDQPRRLPEVKRLQHEAQFGYIATDYSEAYRNGLDTRADWPYADKAWREFLFIRPLQALIILDRLRGSSDSQRPFYLSANWLWTGPHVPAAQVRRSFIMHFETQPVATGNRLAATIGNQTSELITLLPTSPVFRVINEDVPGDEQSGQHRLELDSVGSAESYFLNVVTGYDSGEAAITASLTDNGSSWTLVLTHPTRGNASIVFNKGMTSTGGSVSIGGSAAEPLRETVQGITVTPEGPVWEEAYLFRNGFEP